MRIPSFDMSLDDFFELVDEKSDKITLEEVIKEFNEENNKKTPDEEKLMSLLEDILRFISSERHIEKFDRASIATQCEAIYPIIRKKGLELRLRSTDDNHRIIADYSDDKEKKWLSIEVDPSKEESESLPNNSLSSDVLHVVFGTENIKNGQIRRVDYSVYTPYDDAFSEPRGIDERIFGRTTYEWPGDVSLSYDFSIDCKNNKIDSCVWKKDTKSEDEKIGPSLVYGMKRVKEDKNEQWRLNLRYKGEVQFPELKPVTFLNNLVAEVPLFSVGMNSEWDNPGYYTKPELIEKVFQKEYTKDIPPKVVEEEIIEDVELPSKEGPDTPVIEIEETKDVKEYTPAPSLDDFLNPKDGDDELLTITDEEIDKGLEDALKKLEDQNDRTAKEKAEAEAARKIEEAKEELRRIKEARARIEEESRRKEEAEARRREELRKKLEEAAEERKEAEKRAREAEAKARAERMAKLAETKRRLLGITDPDVSIDVTSYKYTRAQLRNIIDGLEEISDKLEEMEEVKESAPEDKKKEIVSADDINRFIKEMLGGNEANDLLARYLRVQEEIASRGRRK